MWRAVFSLLFVLQFNDGGREYYRFGPSLTAATNIYTEAGSNQAHGAAPVAPEDYYGFDASAKLPKQPPSSLYTGYDDSSDESADQRLASIVGELYQRDNANYQNSRYVDDVAQPEDYYAPKMRSESTNEDYSKSSGVELELDQLRQLSGRIKQLQSSSENNINNGEPEEADGTGLSSDDDESAATAESARTKKGQNEYVGFVAPPDSKKMKHMEVMEKRRPLDEEDETHGSRKSHAQQALSFISGSGNIVFLAFITMCCVLSVVGVVGGMYYYNNVRSRREDPFDDFTRYSPAGPGRDRLKKGGATANGVNGGVGAFSGEKGDDALAYKAQLHHYQQTKQKIIGSAADDALGARGGAAGGDTSDKSDDEDDADLEHNFSVYECPGLAPTGDIEVQNPNFVDSPTQHEKK